MIASADNRLLTIADNHASRLAPSASLANCYARQSVNKLTKNALNISFGYATALETVNMQSDGHAEVLGTTIEKHQADLKGV
ncbi:MAG: hypothetical protein HOC23_06555 [Halieaceae bacterium]|jgi:hypothetical protein|nr:hypothetical protein [Halieaceae bacterium]